MREVVSEVGPDDSRVVLVAFAASSLALLWIGLAFSIEVFGAANPTVLGLNVGLGFGLLAAMTVLYFRLFYPHRVVLERGEDLW